MRFLSEPTVPQAITALTALGTAWEDHIQRRENPINDIVNRMEIPLRDHTRAVWIFVVQRCFANPAITQAQILSALVTQFPSSPYGNFQAFGTAMINFWNFANWAALRDYIVAHQAFFDESFLQGRSGGPTF